MYANMTSKHPWLTALRRRLITGGLIALAALVVLTSPAGAESQPADGESKPEIKSFVSGGKRIGVEVFAPAAPGKYPVLVVLHAVDGPDGALQRMYHTAAREYVGKGYVVLLVHYFDSTGAAKKDVEGYRELFREYFRRKEQTADELKRIKALSAEWTDVVRDAVTYARGREDVDGQRVGMVGFSLGGTLALAAAARHDLKLTALVEFFGTLPRDQRASLKNMPPTLVVHGEDDQVVPVEDAYILIGLLSLRELAHEAEVYPGVGHMFFRDGNDLQAWPLFLANQRTAAFLDKHLKPRGAATARK
jgi:carboxymethylenebutenolidase